MKRKFLILSGIIILSIFLFFLTFKKKSLYSLLKKVESNYAYVDKYFIYGTHFNIEGNVLIDGSVSDAYLVLKNNKDEFKYDISYKLNGNKLSFKTSDYINGGIYLDDINLGNYLLFLKVVGSGYTKYYSLVNNTSYDDLEYYTITKDDKSNLINIGFDSKRKKDFLSLSVSKSHKHYYDVVIDAGHGGDDPGAIYNKYEEASITLDYALTLKERLEDLGLRVKLTRDGDYNIDTYGNHSRTSIPFESKAKYVFSVHLNSSEDTPSGGVEIYAPNSADLGLAKSLASNIIKGAKTKASTNEANMVFDGVYVRTFSNDDIIESVNEAKENGHNPYPITTDTNYYFIIRETGGFMTGAYVDGRNKNYKKNDYYNSNIGVEGYLLELGYINHKNDLNNLLNNKDGYIDGIVDAIKNELNI